MDLDLSNLFAYCFLLDLFMYLISYVSLLYEKRLRKGLRGDKSSTYT